MTASPTKAAPAPGTAPVANWTGFYLNGGGYGLWEADTTTLDPFIGACVLCVTQLGPCTGDQKPGDMIMGNGMKINILDMKKRGAQPGAPLPR
jgi:hypothetical protein